MAIYWKYNIIQISIVFVHYYVEINLYIWYFYQQIFIIFYIKKILKLISLISTKNSLKNENINKFWQKLFYKFEIYVFHTFIDNVPMFFKNVTLI